MPARKAKHFRNRGVKQNTRGKATRARILACARELLRAEGYAGLTIARVCERAGVPPTSIYHHFGDKAGLMVAVLDVVSGRHAERIVASAPKARTSSAAAKRTLAAIRELVLTQPLGALTGIAVLAEGRHVSRDLVAGLRRARDQERATVADRLASVGGAWAESAEDLAIIATAVTNYAALCYRLDRDAAEVDRILASLKTLLKLGA